MVDTAERMFNGPPSDWNPMLPHVITGWGHEKLLHSPLLGLKSFRDQMLRGLADRTPYATLTIRDHHEADFKDGPEQRPDFDSRRRNARCPGGDRVDAANLRQVRAADFGRCRCAGN